MDYLSPYAGSSRGVWTLRGPDVMHVRHSRYYAAPFICFIYSLWIVALSPVCLAITLSRVAACRADCPTHVLCHYSHRQCSHSLV